ncbi:MAG: hypothetical protein Q9218_006804, partial [Villophora microphyllina]
MGGSLDDNAELYVEAQEAANATERERDLPNVSAVPLPAQKPNGKKRSAAEIRLNPTEELS